jgi:hypothetical protein
MLRSDASAPHAYQHGLRIAEHDTDSPKRRIPRPARHAAAETKVTIRGPKFRARISAIHDGVITVDDRHYVTTFVVHGSTI